MPVLPDMVGIVVQDMGKSLAFYRTLGLEIPDGQDGEPYVQVVTSNGYRISWNVESMIREIDPSWQTPVGQRVSLFFKCDSPAHTDEVYQRLVSAGYQGHMPPWDAFWGQRYAIVSDPDGNHVELGAALE